MTLSAVPRAVRTHRSGAISTRQNARHPVAKPIHSSGHNAILLVRVLKHRRRPLKIAGRQGKSIRSSRVSRVRPQR